MRLFVAVWPPEDVVRCLAAWERPAADGVRWTTADQWHATLRFLGAVDDPAVVIDRLRDAPLEACTVRAGPESECLGRAVLCLPVGGLDALAGTVVAATEDVGQAPEDRPFRGHLTLARARPHARRDVLRRLPVLHLDASWVVGEVTVVSSTVGGGGSRYEVVGRVALT